MRVALISSEGQCGIAEHSGQLRAAVLTADPAVEFVGNPDWLDPAAFATYPTAVDLVHLNYHRGLHSRWTPREVADIVRPVIITFHDTYETQPDLLPWDLLALENVKGMVVHEPCDLMAQFIDSVEQPHCRKVHYWRQPCPSATGRGWAPPLCSNLGDGAWHPTLGTLGFDFPWKNYDLLAEVTAACGWNLRIVGSVDGARQAFLLGKNPRIRFDGYLSVQVSIAALSACDATAFLYNCANSGTSGAIRVGIAAGKPLIATKGCRQFRDLTDLHTGIIWADPTAADLEDAMSCIGASAGPNGYDLEVVQFAHRESWTHAGEKYAALYREAVR